MKKFSHSLVLGAVVALTLTACYPPNQVDSDIKVDTGSTFTGKATAPSAATPFTSEPAPAQ